VLKVGHHGSKNSTTPEFLAAMQPRVAIISSGEGNPYGDPQSRNA
jgi:competence protein ComEC